MKKASKKQAAPPAGWSKIAGAKNPAAALLEHFSYLAEKPAEKKLLLAILNRTKSVKMSRQGLVAEFGPKTKLIAAPPYQGKKASGRPASFYTLLKKHEYLMLEDIGGDLILGENGLMDKFAYSHTSLRDQPLYVPLVDFSDWWVFHPEKKRGGEPALCYISHEGGDMYPPSKLSPAALFLKRLGESLEIDDEELKNAAKGPAAGKPGEEFNKANATGVGKKNANAKSGKPGSLIWKFDTKGRISHLLNDEENRLFVLSEGRPLCLDRNAGKKVWSGPNKRKVYNAVLAEGRLICYSMGVMRRENDLIFALDGKTGKTLWQEERKSAGLSFIAAAGQDACAGSDRGELLIINGQTGKTRKKIKVGKGPIAVAPAVQGNVCVVVSGDKYAESNTVSALALQEGKVLWEKKIDRSRTPPAIHEGVAYCILSDGIQGFSLKSGKKVFEYDDYHVETALAFEGSSFCFGGNINFQLVDLKKGEELWSVSGKKFFKGAPLLKDGVAYVGNEDKHLYAFDAKDGKLLWKFKTGDWVTRLPLIVDETLFLGGMDGFAYALTV